MCTVRTILQLMLHNGTAFSCSPSHRGVHDLLLIGR
jgi:hypothetical protein